MGGLMAFRDVSPGARGMFEMAAAPVNAFMEGQQNARRNTLASLQAQQMQSELDDDAEWDAALQSRDLPKLYSLDPQAAQIMDALWQREKMSGLEDISVRPKIDEKAIFDRGMKEREFAAERQDRDRTYRLNAAQEARLSRPQADAGKPQLVDVPMPDGTIQKQWITPGSGVGTPVGSPVAAPAKSTANQAWEMYRTAMDGLESAMGSASTGPIVGRLPAFFADAQTADGAVAAMAPILKQLFRTAGEGTFTDKDQQLLLAMVPTRADRPEARAAKIKNIDSIVRAKLGVNSPDSSAPASSPKSYKTKGGATVEILE